jgi:hypothetical protein
MGGELVELFADLRENLGAEQLDGFEERGVRHAADVHLQDLAGVAEQRVQVKIRSVTWLTPPAKTMPPGS